MAGLIWVDDGNLYYGADDGELLVLTADPRWDVDEGVTPLEECVRDSLSPWLPPHWSDHD